MTIPATESEISYAGDGVTVALPIPFAFDSASDLLVKQEDADGVVTTVTLGFTVSGGSGSTGTLTFAVAPASGVTTWIIDDPPVSQGTDYRDNDAFPAESHERALDKLTRIVKRLSQKVTRAIRYADGESNTDGELADVATRAGKYLFFDAITGAVSYAVSIVGTTLTQSVFNSFLAGSERYKRSPEEIAANVTPVDYSWPPGWIPRYATLADGTDETTKLQEAMDVGMQGLPVIFPKGKTYVATQLDVAAGMRILGHGATSVLKLKDNQPSFTRLLTTEDNLHDDANDSELLEIDGMCFDGNRSNQGTYTGFQKEQQSPIFLAGDNVQAGRLRFRISNCYFRDTAGDGIHQYWNSDGVVENCFFQDCFRSSVAVTGGYSKLRISDCRGIGATHDSRFQIEIDGAGYNGQKTMELLMDTCDWAGGLDMAADGGTVILCSNTIFRANGNCIINMDGSLTGVKSFSTYVNCTFRPGGTSSSTHRLFRYGVCKFIGCDFEWTNAASHTNFIQPSTLTGQSLTFDNCNFRGDSTYHTTSTVAMSTATWASGLLTVNTAAVHGLAVNDYVEIAGFVFATTDVNGIYRVNSVVDTDTFTVGVPRDPGAATAATGTTRKRSALNALSMSADTAASQNQIHVVNCKFDAAVDCAFDMQQGGWLSMRGNHVDGGLLYDAGAAASFLFDVRIGQYTTGTKHRQMCHVTGSVAGCILRHEMTYVPVELSGFTRSSNLTGLSMFGSRLIYGAGAVATSDPGFIGDIYRRRDPAASTIQQSVCTVAGQSGATTTWKTETTTSA